MNTKIMKQLFYAACVTLLMTGSAVGMKLTGDWLKDGEEYLKENNIPKAMECFKTGGVEGNKEAFKRLCELHALDNPYIYTLNALCYLSALPQTNIKECRTALQSEGLVVLKKLLLMVDEGQAKELLNQIKEAVLQDVENDNGVNSLKIIKNISDQQENASFDEELLNFFNNVRNSLVKNSSDFYAKDYLKYFKQAEKNEKEIKFENSQKERKKVFDNQINEMKKMMFEKEKNFEKKENFFTQKFKEKENLFTKKIEEQENLFTQKIEALKVQEYKAPSYITDEAFIEKIKGMPFLASVNLFGCKNLTDKGIEFLVDNCPKITSIDLGGCTGLTDASLKALEKISSSLTSFGIEGCKNFTDNGLWELIKDCKWLIHFDLSAGKGLCLSSICYVTNCCPELTSIRLRHLDLNPVIYTALCGVHLRSIDLSCCNGVSFKGMQRIVQKCKLLTSIDLSFCETVTDEVIKGLEENGQSLKEIFLEGTKVSEEGKKLLREKIPGIKIDGK